jgi:hypothetical protein
MQRAKRFQLPSSSSTRAQCARRRSRRSASSGHLLGHLLERLRFAHRREHRLLGGARGFPSGTQRTSSLRDLLLVEGGRQRRERVIQARQRRAGLPGLLILVAASIAWRAAAICWRSARSSAVSAAAPAPASGPSACSSCSISTNVACACAHAWAFEHITDKRFTRSRATASRTSARARACGAPASASQRWRAASEFPLRLGLLAGQPGDLGLGVRDQRLRLARVTQQLATALQVRAGAGHLAGQAEPAREFLGLQRGPTRLPFDAGDALLGKPHRPSALRQLMGLLAAGFVRALRSACTRCASGRRLSACRTAPASASTTRHRCRDRVKA